tara:strand:+ start:4214 stop:4438 length:225 start_codon:yes stop_codon:yes gene_type:complete
MRAIRLKHDVVIPAGTVLYPMDGTVRTFHHDSYEASLGLTRDSYGAFGYSIERGDPAFDVWFESVEDQGEVSDS